MNADDVAQASASLAYPELYGRVVFDFARGFGVPAATASAVSMAQFFLRERGVEHSERIVRPNKKGELEFWPIFRCQIDRREPDEVRFIVGAEAGKWWVPSAGALAADEVTHVWLFQVDRDACRYQHWLVPVCAVALQAEEVPVWS